MEKIEFPLPKCEDCPVSKLAGICEIRNSAIEFKEEEDRYKTCVALISTVGHCAQRCMTFEQTIEDLKEKLIGAEEELRYAEILVKYLLEHSIKE